MWRRKVLCSVCTREQESTLGLCASIPGLVLAEKQNPAWEAVTIKEIESNLVVVGRSFLVHSCE